MERKNVSELQRGNLDNEASLDAARLANLLTLSYEPMIAWRLDGPIEFWNAGAEQLYGFALSEAVGRMLSCARNSRAGSPGWASCATSARMVARSSSRAACRCLVTTLCWKPIAMLLHA